MIFSSYVQLRLLASCLPSSRRNWSILTCKPTRTLRSAPLQGLQSCSSPNAYNPSAAVVVNRPRSMEVEQARRAGLLEWAGLPSRPRSGASRGPCLRARCLRRVACPLRFPSLLFGPRTRGRGQLRRTRTRPPLSKSRCVWVQKDVTHDTTSV